MAQDKAKYNNTVQQFIDITDITLDIINRNYVLV